MSSPTSTKPNAIRGAGIERFIGLEHLELGSLHIRAWGNVADGTTFNRLVITNQWTFQAGAIEKRFDVVFVVNGLPLVIAEAKTPTRSAVIGARWVAAQVPPCACLWSGGIRSLQSGVGCYTPKATPPS